MGFASDLNKLCKRAGDKADLLVRKVAMDLGGQMIEKSPVDTGRFKNNWQTSLGGLNKSTSAGADASASQAVGALHAAVGAWNPGQTIFISNSLPYAQRLEMGWSKQAPAGIVRLTVQNYAEAVRKAAQEVRNS